MVYVRFGLQCCRSWASALALLLVAYLPQHLLASSGDRAWVFHACVQNCQTTGCIYLVHAPAGHQPNRTCIPSCLQQGDPDVAAPAIPLTLRILRWSCQDDCKYHCMRAVEAQKRASGQRLPVEKYFGKWPFLRVLGMQELASVLASLANLAAHALCLRRLRAAALSEPSRSASSIAAAASHQLPPQGSSVLAGHASPVPYPFLLLWTMYGYLHMNAWIWSALFHCRDTRLTERLDYTSAISLIAFGLFAALVRTLWGPGRRRRLLVAAAGGAVATGVAAHLYYMLRVKFDYGWNMRVCVAAGVATAGLWLTWVTVTRHPARRRMYTFLVLAHGAMLLEVLDFPPVYGLLDAHACWHVATVVLTPLFYRWLLDDVTAFESKSKDT